MYNKQEASAARQKFWTRFGQYMLPVPAADNEKVNWVNYRTGIKGISFKTDADNNCAEIFIEISLPDKIMQQHYFDIFLNFKKQFEAAAGKEWDFKKDFITAHGNSVSRISAVLNEINIFRETDWPAMISFLKQHIIALDKFWEKYKPAFE